MGKIIVSVFAIITCVFFVTIIYAENSRPPEVTKLGSLSDKYEPVRFEHDKHASMAGNCGMCHHQHGNSGTLTCKECHSVTAATFKNAVVNNFMACKNCHSDYNSGNPGMPGLKVAYHQTCFQCHRGMGNVGIDPKGCTEMCHAAKEQKISKK